MEESFNRFNDNCQDYMRGRGGYRGHHRGHHHHHGHHMRKHYKDYNTE